MLRLRLPLKNLLIALLASVCALCASLTLGAHHFTAVVALSASIGLCALLVLDACADVYDRPNTLFAALFFLVLVCGPGLTHASMGVFPFFYKTYDDSDVSLAALILLLFLTATTAAVLATPLRLRKEYTGKSVREPKINALPAVAVLLLFAALLALSVAIMGLSTMTATRGSITFARNPVQALVEMGGRYSAFYLLWINLWAVKARGRLWLLPLFITIPLFLLVNNPVSIPRTITIAYVIILGVTFFPFNRPIWKYLAATSYSVFLVLLAPLLHQISRGVRGGTLFASPVKYFTTSGDLDGFQSTVNVVILARDVGFMHGKQLLSAALIFVPRTVWPDKGVSTGALAAWNAGYAFTNVSAPLPSELYFDFGVVGVVLGGALFGALIVQLDQAADACRRAGRLTGLLPFVVSAAFVGIVVRGALIGVLALVGFAILLGLLVSSLETDRARPGKE